MAVTGEFHFPPVGLFDGLCPEAVPDVLGKLGFALEGLFSEGLFSLEAVAPSCVTLGGGFPGMGAAAGSGGLKLVLPRIWQKSPVIPYWRATLTLLVLISLQ